MLCSEFIMITTLWMFKLKELGRLCWVWPWAGCEVPTKLLCHSLLFSWIGGGEYNKRLVGWGKGKEITQHLPSWTKQTQLRNYFNVIPIKIRVMRSKTKFTPSLHPSLFPGLSWLCQTWRKPLEASQRSHPCSPSQPKFYHAKPSQEIFSFREC